MMRCTCQNKGLPTPGTYNVALNQPKSRGRYKNQVSFIKDSVKLAPNNTGDDSLQKHNIIAQVQASLQQ
eukprot:m.72478 g.72478  ORF g.72478 m.72478 type:complete len:69 (+) comp12336_c1_seq5:2999-3205(+)